MMRKFLTGAALAAAAIVTPSIAAADNTSVGVGVGNLNPDFAGDADFYALSAGWNHAFGGGWNVQAAGQIDQVDFGGGTEIGTSYGAISAGLRNETYAAYGYVGLSDTLVLGASGTMLGVGGQYYLGNFVFDASYGHEDINAFDLEVDSFDVGAAYFITPNIGVSAQLGRGTASDSMIGDEDIDSYGVGAVWRLSNSPIAFNARWRHDEVDDGGPEFQTWMLSVNLNFGTETAHAQATEGPSWSGPQLAFDRTLLLN